jgi:hypothetical protein
MGKITRGIASGHLYCRNALSLPESNRCTGTTSQLPPGSGICNRVGIDLRDTGLAIYVHTTDRKGLRVISK